VRSALCSCHPFFAFWALPHSSPVASFRGIQIGVANGAKLSYVIFSDILQNVTDIVEAM
jgi:hypothetical protein